MNVGRLFDCFRDLCPSRDDVPVSERKSDCAASLAVLSRHEAGVAAAVGGEYFRAGHMFGESARRLPGPDDPIRYFEFFRTEDDREGFGKPGAVRRCA
ncbi:hypothetical protein IVB14_01805 [Bradyrhizobium sp. 180]|uniref:hypothetical protein n=1 Tax=Bradyrhizobium sp. 180 TaxID=2782650 RepID=UPI001FFB50CF|nr:hypothetical protein [Bradyrhizobium sp. 180]MCK1489191.1 hypothetical protein [Bradyrhizobium sp. 180]